MSTVASQLLNAWHHAVEEYEHYVMTLVQYVRVVTVQLHTSSVSMYSSGTYSLGCITLHPQLPYIPSSGYDVSR